MENKKVLNLSAWLVVLTAVLNYLAINFGWYIKFWYTDIIMHTLGGFFLGVFYFWFWFASKYTGFFSHNSKKIFYVIISVLLTVIGWEIFEYSLGLSYYPEGYVFDTTLDMILGTLGAILIFGILYKKFIKNKI